MSVPLKEFFRLIRWRNLIIVILTMVMVRYLILEPLLGRMILTSITRDLLTASLQLPLADFILLLVATVSLTAGGYVINDYFDIKTDIINKGEAIVGLVISRRKAMMLHNIFNAVGVIAGFVLSWRVGYTWLGVIFLVVSGLLYFYSASYKRQLLVGNIIVAFLTAMVPLLVFFYEFSALFEYYQNNALGHPDYRILLFWCAGFALFAFLTTLVREIVKDVEDFKGDAEYGRRTLPVALGLGGTRLIISSLILIIIVCLIVVWHVFIRDVYTLLYISFLLIVPLSVAGIMVIRSSSRRVFGRVSTLIKLIMLAGLLYMVVVRIILSTGAYLDAF